jgi:hypothetical protein
MTMQARGIRMPAARQNAAEATPQGIVPMPHCEGEGVRAIAGGVFLLITLAILGVLAMRQMKSVHASVDATVPGVSAASAATQREAQQMPQRVVDDVNTALSQGAQRNQDADK